MVPPPPEGSPPPISPDAPRDPTRRRDDDSSGCRVIVVVLTWNSCDVTADCLHSLRRSRFAAFHLVVVDNGSTDGTAGRLRQMFPEVTVLETGRNLGFTGGMNTGLRWMLSTAADHAVLLNNDTIVDPEALGALVAALDAEPDVAVACPKIYFWDAPQVLWFAGGRLSLWTGIGVNVGRRETDRGQYDRRRDITFANGCVLALRRATIERVGLLDESLFAYAEDTDYSLRVRARGGRLVYVPAARIWHREGFASKTNLGNPKRIYYGTRNQLRVFARHARPWHWLTLAPAFAVNWIGRFVLLALIRRDQPGQVVREIARGLADFIRMARGSPPRWGEPRDWARRPASPATGRA